MHGFQIYIAAETRNVEKLVKQSSQSSINPVLDLVQPLTSKILTFLRECQQL